MTRTIGTRQTPVLFDGEVKGESVNRYAGQPQRIFFVLDRVTGAKSGNQRVRETNWTKGIDAKQGQPIPNPAKEPQIDGALVTPNRPVRRIGCRRFQSTNGLFYINASRGSSAYYITTMTTKPGRLGGNDKGGYAQSMLQAIDYKTGKVAWSHKWESSGIRSGVLSTAGNLVSLSRSRKQSGGIGRETGTAIVARQLWQRDEQRSHHV